MLIITPRIDGERWIEPIEGLQLLVTSIDGHQFRSRNALVRRHIDRLDGKFKVGTSEFTLSEVGDIDSIDDLLLENCARHLVKDWKGVGELADGKEQEITYSPEKCMSLLRQHPELYWQIVATANEIAEGKEAQKKEAVEK